MIRADSQVWRAYQEVERAFSEGDQVQLTAPSKDLHVAYRELGTIENINHAGDVQIRMGPGREVRFTSGSIRIWTTVTQ